MGLIDVLGRRRTYLDANIFIYAVEGFAAYEGALRRLFEAVDRGALSIATSELTLAEVLVGPVKEGKREAIKAYGQAIQARGHFEVLPVSRQVLFQAAMIRAKYAQMKLPDAVPIATAEQHVGSTAVPGLAAKPILDIAVGVPRLEQAGDPQALSGLTSRSP